MNDFPPFRSKVEPAQAQLGLCGSPRRKGEVSFRALTSSFFSKELYLRVNWNLSKSSMISKRIMTGASEEMTIDEIKDLKSSEQANTIGELLKTKREQQKLSIREISAKTKIRQKIIVYLEEDNFSKLPNRAYIIGFLKTLAETFGIDYVEVVELYDKTVTETLGIKSPPVECHFKYNDYSKKSTKTSFIIIISSIAIIGLIIFNLIGKSKTESKNFFVPAKRENIVSFPSVKKFSDAKNDKDKIAEPKIIKLSVKAIDGPCWIAYQVDEAPIVKYTMQKGKTLLLSGQMIKLQIGNYEVINIEKDNTPVKITQKVKSSTAHLIFPENLVGKIKPPFFIFHDDGSVESRKTNDDNEKIIKDI